MRVTVTGATGRTGGATLRALRGRDVELRAVTRDATSSRARGLGPDVEVVAADPLDAGALAVAFADSDAIFLVQPAFDDRGRHDADLERAQATAAAEAVGRAGVTSAVLLGAGPGVPTGIGHFDTKLHARDELARCGVATTTLLPAPFMELLTDPGYAPALSTWGAQPRIVGWDLPLPWVAVADIGRVAASCLLDPPEHGTAIPLAGDVLSLRDARARLRSCGRASRGVPVPEWLARRMLGAELPDMWRWMVDHAADLPVRHPSFLDRCSDPLDVTSWTSMLGQDEPVAADAT